MTASAKLSKGPAWEFRTHRALFTAGWYVRRNLDLRERIAGSPQTMAEVDVLAISFDAGLNARRLVGECKDRKGSAKEADRVIWLLGLGALLDVDELLFAKPAIAPATVVFARTTRVSLFDQAAAVHTEERLDRTLDAGAFDPVVAQQVVAPAVTRDAFSDARLREAYDWAHNASWFEAPLARLRRLPGFFRVVAQHADGVTRQVLMIEGLLAVLACGLQVAGLLRRHAPTVGRTLATEQLASGAAPASALRDIGARADEYYRDVIDRLIENSSGSRSLVDVPRLAEHIARPPAWADGFFAFADGLGARPEAATDVLRFAELTLFETLAGRDPRSALELYVRTDHHWLGSVLASAAGFCARVWGIQDPLLDALRHAPQGATAVSDPAAAAAGPPGGASPPASTDDLGGGEQGSLLDAGGAQQIDRT